MKKLKAVLFYTSHSNSQNLTFVLLSLSVFPKSPFKIEQTPNQSTYSCSASPPSTWSSCVIYFFWGPSFKMPSLVSLCLLCLCILWLLSPCLILSKHPPNLSMTICSSVWEANTGFLFYPDLLELSSSATRFSISGQACLGALYHRHWPLSIRLKIFSDKRRPLNFMYLLLLCYYHICIFPSQLINYNSLFFSSLPISKSGTGQEIPTLIN